MRAEQLTDAVAYHGEGPVWDAATERLLWVDMFAGDVLSTDVGGETSRRALRRSGRVRRAARVRRIRDRDRCGFMLVAADGATHALPDAWDDVTVRMNDGGCDPDGRFLCGSMATDAAKGRGAMYRLDPDHSVTQLFAGVTISNGLGWSPDGSVAYYVDTPTQRIDACAARSVRRRHSFRFL